MKKLVLEIIYAMIYLVRKNVKCLAILLLVAGFFSCERNEEIGKKELSPPEWIQGEWEYDGFVYIANSLYFVM